MCYFRGFYRCIKIMYFGLFLGIILSYSCFSFAQVTQPSDTLSPMFVVQHQLKALQFNDTPYKDFGIQQTWAFAHPINKKMTGPLIKFKRLIHNSYYKSLLNHITHEIKLVRNNEDQYIFDVMVKSKEKKIYYFEWQVKKFVSPGPLSNCWLTISVSIPRDKNNTI